MKKTYAIVILAFASLTISAQVDRVPMMEIFSSSTCPPCKPASDVYNPLLDQFHGKIAVVKYPMSWPGAGDPYFTDEGGERRSFYGVSGVPDIYVNGTSVSYNSFDSAYFASLLTDESYMILELKYFVDEDNHRVYYAVHMKTEDIFFGGDFKMYMSINESVTYDNATSNGETEFHHIMKKMLPTESGNMGIELGDSIVTGFKLDTSSYFEFKGQYRLPPNAQDPIDLEAEHSVEEFNDLEMMLWVSNTTSKEVVQAAIGKEVESLEELGFEAEPVDNSDPKFWPIGLETIEPFAFELFPNPAKDKINVKLSESTDFTIIMTDLLGKRVVVENYSAKSQVSIDVMNLPEGVYMVQLITGDHSYFDRVIVK